MRGAAIGIGCFILFALAFNGGIGSFTPVAVVSALSIILSGLLLLGENTRPAAFWLGILSGVCYLSVIYQRFDFTSGIDRAGLAFDFLYLGFLLTFLERYGRKAPPTPNKSLERTRDA